MNVDYTKNNTGYTMKKQSAFILIILMIVDAIITILAAIAMPAYNNYRVRSAEGACQAEAKAYMNSAVSANLSSMAAVVPQARACATPAAAITAITGQTVFTPRAPGVRTTTCQNGSATCVLAP